MSRKRLVWLVSMLIFAVLAAACTSSGTTPVPQTTPQDSSGNASTAPQGDPIVLGEIVSQSGAFAIFTNGHKGAQLAVEEINAKGGVLGRPLELTPMDDKSSPEEGTKIFREFADKNVLAVIGNTGPVTYAVQPMAKEMKVPYIVNQGYGANLTEELNHRYFFRTITSDRVFAHAFAEHLSKQSATRYCTIGSDFAYGHSITTAVMNRLKELKPAVTVIPGCEFWAAPGTLEFTAQITAILGQKPDALMFGGVVAISADAFVKQAKAFGLFDKIMGVHPSLGMPTNNAGLKKADLPMGILTGSDYPYPPIQNKVNDEFLKAYTAKWNETPYEISASAYTSVYLIAKAIEKAGKVEREALVDALEGMSIEHPTMGEITIRPFDHQSTSGWWIGELAWDDANNRVGLKDPDFVPGSTYLLSEEAWKKAMAK